MKFKSTYFLLALAIIPFIFQSCTEEQKMKQIDLQGHRGCRGLMPENTIEGFIKALEIGVNTLEMDVVISKDGKVLLSHDPFMSHEICLDSIGAEISEEQEKSFNMYKMTYQEIIKFDCGLKPHPRFPEQEKIASVKPLLSEVIDTVEEYLISQSTAQVQYNIETKSTPDGDGIYNPPPAEFAELLIKVITEKNILSRTIIQSFDIRTIQYIKQHYPKVKIALLIESDPDYKKNIHQLGFVPDIYSPNFFLVDKDLMDFAEDKGMKVIPWTLNDKTSMGKVIELGVDGIITDYPDIAKEVLQITRTGNR